MWEGVSWGVFGEVEVPVTPHTIPHHTTNTPFSSRYCPPLPCPTTPSACLPCIIGILACTSHSLSLFLLLCWSVYSLYWSVILTTTTPFNTFLSFYLLMHWIYFATIPVCLHCPKCSLPCLSTLSSCFLPSFATPFSLPFTQELSSLSLPRLTVSPELVFLVYNLYFSLMNYPSAFYYTWLSRTVHVKGQSHL